MSHSNDRSYIVYHAGLGRYNSKLFSLSLLWLLWRTKQPVTVASVVGSSHVSGLPGTACKDVVEDSLLFDEVSTDNRTQPSSGS